MDNTYTKTSLLKKNAQEMKELIVALKINTEDIRGSGVKGKVIKSDIIDHILEMQYISETNASSRKGKSVKKENLFEKLICTVDDLFRLIMKDIFKDGSGYKVLTLVCKKWNILSKNIQPNADITLCNHINTVMKMMPLLNIQFTKEKIWKDVCSNSTINMEFVKNNLSQIEWPTISRNKAVATEANVFLIPRNKKYKWKLDSMNEIEAISRDHYVSRKRPRVSIKWEDLDRLNKKNCFNFTHDSSCTLQLVIDNPEINWDYSHVLGVMVDDFDMACENFFDRCNINFFKWISSNKNVMTADLLIKCTFYNDMWDYKALSSNPSIVKTWKLVTHPLLREHITEWDWKVLFRDS